jgi:hypothetical protein
MSNTSGSTVPPSSGPVSRDPVSSSAIRVGPAPKSAVPPPPPSPEADGGSRGSGSGPEFRVWSWEYTGGGRRPGISWLGVLLLVVGTALFINLINPAVDLGSLFLLGLGIAAALAWLVGGWTGATVPALVLLAWGIQGLLSDTGQLRGPGWSAVAIATGLLLAWLIGLAQHRRRTWALWGAVILGLYGATRVSNELYPSIPDVGWLAAVALIVVGIAMLVRRRNGAGLSDP